MNPILRESLLNHVVELYAAITDQDAWRSVLQRMSGNLGSTGLSLLIGDHGAASVTVPGMPASQIDAVRDWLSSRVQPQSDPPQAPQKADGFLLPPACATAIPGLPGRHCLARLDHQDRTIGYAVLYRDSDRPDFDDEAIESFRTLTPHLAQALALALRVAAAEVRSWRCTQCEQLQPFGCMLLDVTGSILEMNDAASQIVGANDGLRVEDNRLCAIRAVDRETLDRGLDEILGAGSSAAAAFVTVPRPSGRRRYAIFLRRMSAHASPFAARVPHARLVIVDTDRGSNVPRDVMRAVYELTETESRVAWHLAEGETPEQIAARLGIAHTTLRHHLERIFAKTGTHRQSDLVRLLQTPFISIGGAR